MIKKQEDGSWLVDIRPNGRNSNRVRKTFDTQREAKEFEHWLKAQKDSEAWEKVKDNRTLNDGIQKWWEQLGSTQASGKDKHGRLINISQRLGNPLLNKIDEDLLLSYRASRISESKGKSKISFNTANKEIIFVRSVLKFLNLTPPKVKPLKVATEELAYLEIDQIETLLNEIKSCSIGAYVACRVCFETGARLGEATEIRSIDVKNNLLTLPSKHTKNGKPRYIPISAELAELIKNHSPFPNPLSTFRRCIDKCGIELPDGQLTHVMRHTFSAHFMINGGNIVTLQRVLDHGDIKVTMRYAHLSPDHLNDVLKYKPIINT